MRYSSSLYFIAGMLIPMFIALSFTTGCSEDSQSEAIITSVDVLSDMKFHFAKNDISESVFLETSFVDASLEKALYDPQNVSSEDTSIAVSDILSVNPQTGKKDEVFLADVDKDGLVETLYMASNSWVLPVLVDKDVFIYGNGGCFDGKLEEFDRVKAKDGYYIIDFSKFAFGCTVDFSLISEIGTDGNPPTKTMSNWYWWQNARFCGQGSSLCELKNNGYSWEDWLIRVSWHPYFGLNPEGNGFTNNSQLQ